MDQLASIEQRLGRLRIISLLSFALAAGSLAYALMDKTGPVQDGQLWQARDASGRVRGVFGVSTDGVGLTMYDTTGQMRLDVGIAPNGVPGILLLSKIGQPVATLNLVDGSVPTLRLTNVAESTRIVMTPRIGTAPLSVSLPGRPDTMIARRPRRETP